MHLARTHTHTHGLMRHTTMSHMCVSYMAIYASGPYKTHTHTPVWIEAGKLPHALAPVLARIAERRCLTMVAARPERRGDIWNTEMRVSTQGTPQTEVVPSVSLKPTPSKRDTTKSGLRSKRLGLLSLYGSTRHQRALLCPCRILGSACHCLLA